MTRNYMSSLDLLAVSANNKETAINTEQTLDTTMLVSEDTILSLDPRREHNGDELTGKEEPDTVYDLGALVSGSLSFPKAQAQHVAFLLSYGHGSSTPATWGTGKKHTILPTSGSDLPGFTAAMRLGQTILKRRFASCYLDDVKLTYARDAWLTASGTVKGTGKYTDSVVKETITAAFNASSLTLAANAVQGSDAPTRLDNVHSIRVVNPAGAGEYIEVSFSAVSSATPAVITITPPGGAATSTTYEVLYVPTEAAWCTFPARVTEPPLRVTDLVMKIGGKWDGSAFQGGRTLGAEIESVEYSLKPGTNVEFRVGGTGTYASSMFRNGRSQTLALKQQMRSFLLQQKIKDNEYIGVYLKATGAEFETGKNYYVEQVFPRCAVLKAPITASNKILAEAGDLIILQDDTYGTCINTVANKVAGYAQ